MNWTAERSDSYLFWTNLMEKSPEKVKGYTIKGKLPGEYTASWFQGSDICPICHGSQYLQIKGSDKQIYCLCSTLAWMDDISRNNKEVESFYEPCKLSDLTPIEVPTPKAGQDLIKLVGYIQKWINNPTSWIWIQGGYGCGKSHVLKSIKTAIPHITTYVSMEDFQDKIFRYRNTPELDSFTTMLSTTPILLLDDWGIEYSKSDWTLSTLSGIVNRRYQMPEKLSMVVTSNVASIELKASPDNQVRRIIDRLTDINHSERFQLTQASFRSADTHRKLK